MRRPIWVLESLEGRRCAGAERNQGQLSLSKLSPGSLPRPRAAYLTSAGPGPPGGPSSSRGARSPRPACSTTPDAHRSAPSLLPAPAPLTAPPSASSALGSPLRPPGHPPAPVTAPPSGQSTPALGFPGEDSNPGLRDPVARLDAAISFTWRFVHLPQVPEDVRLTGRCASTVLARTMLGSPVGSRECTPRQPAGSGSR